MCLILSQLIACGPGMKVKDAGVPVGAQAVQPTGKMFWGVNAHLPATDTTQAVPALDRAVEMHMSYVRLDMRWDIVEPTSRSNIQQAGEWQVLDASVAQAVQRGLRPLLILGAAPAWASTNGGENGTLTAEGKTHFVEYVRAMALRYQGQVEYFEVGNEPNLNQFWIGTTDEYIDQLLLPSIQAIKSINPNLKIVGPSLSGLLSADIKVEDFFRRLGERQTAEGKRFFDIISHHAYSDTPAGIIDDLTKGRKSCYLSYCITQRESILKILSDNGFSTEPIWLDEFGWTSATDAEAEVQGQKVLETLQKLAAVPRIEAAFVYHLSDDPRIAKDYGLLKSDHTPKKSYYHLRDARP